MPVASLWASESRFTEAEFNKITGRAADALAPAWMLKVKPTATELPLPPSVKIHTNEGFDPFPTEWTEFPRAFRTA